MNSTNTKNGPETRQRILDAAEALFVENGLKATSLRLITTRAEVNLAAVNYHFGSKEQLIHEVFERRLANLSCHRLDALERLEKTAAGSSLKPSDILEAFFRPALELATDTENGGREFMRLLGCTYIDPSAFVRKFIAEENADTLDRFLNALFHSLPGVPRDEILWRFHFMIGATFYAIADTQVIQSCAGYQFEDSEPSKMLSRLMSFLLGGLRAPLPDYVQEEKRVDKQSASI